MHKIDGIDATPDRRFQDPNPSAGVLGTVLTAKWLNAVQEELVGLVERAGLTPSDLDDGQVLAALQLLYGTGASAGSLRNLLVNGSFDLWQRGATHSISNVSRYTADRWSARADAEGSGAGLGTVSQQPFAPGQAEVPGASSFLRWVQTTGASVGAPSLIQRVENLERFSAVPLAISFSARASSAISAAARAFQVPGAGGSADVQIGVEPFTLSTSWQRFTFAWTTPSLVGITLGTNPHVRVSITLPVGSTFTFELADVQLEFAEQATTFDRRPLPIELLLASRYYQKSYPLAVAPGTDGGVPAQERAGAGYGIRANVVGTQRAVQVAARLFPRMRAAPTVTWHKPGNGTTAGRLDFLTDAGEVEAVVASTVGTSESYTGWPIVDPFPAGNGRVVAAHWTAEAEL